ncbi:MAG: B12-binding domain-containing radical SAM protein [Chitinivibrionales bacterium]
MKKRMLLVYTGYEQGSWGSTAYPEKSHYYIMPGILYLASALKNDPDINRDFEILYKYFNATIQDKDEIKSGIEAAAPDIIGFSTYCWNTGIHAKLAEFCKKSFPECSVILGGPEVSIKDPDEYTEFFIKHSFADAALAGDSEAGIVPLVQYIGGLSEDPSLLKPGTFLSPDYNTDPVCTASSPIPPADIPEIFPFDKEGIRVSSEAGLAIVYETCRGCPYKCIYCKFGHRNRVPEHRDRMRIEREVKWILSEGFECIHFADAVFDLDPEFAKWVCRLILKYNIRTSVFFYCSFLRIDREMSELFRAIQAQIGVGIQSTDRGVIRNIKRNLHQSLFTDKRDILSDSGMNFYTDLMFGLPGGDINTFRKSVNDVVSINPGFIMLFPLSLIKGTELEENSREYGITEYSEKDLEGLSLMCDLEYKNIGLSSGFSLDDLERFDNLAVTLFYFYNRFYHSLMYVVKRSDYDPFDVYDLIGKRTKEFLKNVGKKLSNTDYIIDNFEDEIFDIFKSVCYKEKPYERELEAFREIFTLDIMRIIMLNAAKRRKLFEAHLKHGSSGNEPPAKFQKDTRLMKISFVKISSIPFSYNDITSLSDIRGNIRYKKDKIILSASFKRWDALIRGIDDKEEFILKSIPENRGVSFESLLRRFKRSFRHKHEEGAAEELKAYLNSFAQEDIISHYPGVQ